MKQLASTLTLCALALFGFAQTSAQQVIASAGSYTTGGSVSLSSTIGESIVTTHNAPSNMLTQGFQQPEYTIVNSITEAAGETLFIRVYPNPTAGNIAIDLQSNHGEELFLIVTDLLGQIVMKQNLFMNTFNAIDLRCEANGQYILGIMDKQGILLSTHHINKIQ